MRASIAIPARAGLFALVACVQLAALTAMGLTRPGIALVEGGAPVVNLALVPAPRFDGTNAAEQASSRDAPSTPASATEPTTRPPEATPETMRGDATPAVRPADASMPAATATPPASTAAARPPGVSGPASPAPAVTAPTVAATASRAGQTEGGGARTPGAAAASAEDAYAARVMAWVEQHKGRPAGRLAGVTTISLVLDRQGRVRDVGILAGSGDRRLDATALDALRAAQPYPRPPAGVVWRTREFRMRLDYRPSGRPS
jgi:protein TonB